MKPIEVIAMLGIPGSGKSTRAKEIAHEHPGPCITTGRDMIREALFGVDYKPTNAKEKQVSEAKQLYISTMFADEHVSLLIIDDTHCSKRGRAETEKMIREAAEESNREYTFRYELMELSFDPDRCHKNNVNRNRSVPFEVIENMFLGFLDFVREREDMCPDWLPSKALTEGCNYTNEYIVDIDGTVASHEGIRSPFDWDKVDQDKPKSHVIGVLSALKHAEHQLVFFSGRDGSCYNKTKQWLDLYVGRGYTGLYMREPGSQEKDFKVKMRMYKEEFAQKGFRPIAVFDDRLQVVRYWRAIGLPVFQVEAGLF